MGTHPIFESDFDCLTGIDKVAEMALEDCICIVMFALLTSLLSEGISYALVYRKDSYKKLNASIEKASKKLNELEKSSKKYKKEEEKIKEMSQKLQTEKMPSLFATGLCFASIVSTVSSMYEGQSIAVLPFEPAFFVKSLAQRGLPMPKPNDCSFFFLYILSPMMIRQPLQKILGFAQSRSTSKLSTLSFQPQNDATQTYGS